MGFNLKHFFEILDGEYNDEYKLEALKIEIECHKEYAKECGQL